MINVVPNALIPEQCATIIRRGNWLVRLSSLFNQQEYGIKRSFVQPFIRNILKTLEPYFPDGEYSAELVRYDSGIENPEHVDFKGDFPTGFLNKKTVEWKYTGIVLLNTEYEGGTLYFPRCRKLFKKESLGTLITFPAGPQDFKYTHGVTTITTGTRYTLVLRFI
jgi:hypothetical protein